MHSSRIGCLLHRKGRRLPYHAVCHAVLRCRVLAPNKTIEIRLDKLDDAYGSPGLEDIERFSRALAEVGGVWIGVSVWRRRQGGR